MKQSGNTTQNANLQEFLDSAVNAAELGQRQFFTPPGIAAALFRPLPGIRKQLITDLHFGSGALARASGAIHALGLDIDARVTGELDEPADAKWQVEQADLTHWYPIAVEADLQFPFITINPPFSLRWYADRLTALRESQVKEVAKAASKYGEHIDSTLASFLIALDRLLPLGEGFMVCNANTARRFLGEPYGPAGDAPHTSLLKHVWLWLDIPGKIFENQMTDFPTAVLSFSRSHGEAYRPPHAPTGPLHLVADAADTLAVQSALMIPEVFDAHRGSRYTYEHEFSRTNIVSKFHTIAKEYAVRHRNKKPEWNISIDDKGRLCTYLTPFQSVSKRISPTIAARLHALHHQTPAALCVTATSRTVLREAAEGGIWRIHPDVTTAIAAAMAAHEAEGAPFYKPNAVQALGWVDEHSTLACIQPGIGTAKPGDRCEIKCTIEPTSWEGTKINLVGDEECLEFLGKELLVKLTDSAGCEHHFHVRRDDAQAKPQVDPGGTVRIQHWHIADLIQHFQVPIPQDITALHPEAYRENLAILDRLQERIRTVQAAAV